MEVVKIKNLSVVLGSHKALNTVNLQLPAGKLIDLIGPSGAGKTTLIRTLVGSIKPTVGKVEVLGQPAGSSSLRSLVSYMPQEISVYPDLTVKENLRYFITIDRQNNKSAKDALDRTLAQVHLSDKADVIVSNLSGGEQQRVSLAVCLIGSPELIVLDEPTVGLDPILREELWHLFSDLTHEGKTLIISSHSMDEAGKCEDLILIREGVIIAHSSPQEFLAKAETKSIEEGFIKLVGNKS